MFKSKIQTEMINMFSFEEIMTPVWDTDIVYGESLTFIKENGVAKAPLMFSADEILKVESANMLHVYEEGVDYTLENNHIVLTPESKIFSFEYEDIYFKEKGDKPCFKEQSGGYILFHEGHFFHDRQVAVTYKCKKGQWEGIKPAFASNLKKTYKKLTQDKNLRVTLFGDSISAGANASGRTIQTPFQPSYGYLVAEALRRHYDANVTFENPSVGGMNSGWGVRTAKERVCSTNPDLVIIAFGMNDRCQGDEHREIIAEIRRIILENNPECEFIIVSTSLPNSILTTEENWFWRYQYQYYEALLPLECEGTQVANIRDMQLEALKTKRFIDMTGNNVNHPNDFFQRMYAQFISQMLIK
ncbi:MAG: SGNH/GDSL hydrolase family protein [Ruminococcaceae bacterium]|nr:SGNH/GDSL hydrolase family protein [Oscillospiraceae bacterium]